MLSNIIHDFSFWDTLWCVIFKSRCYKGKKYYVKYHFLPRRNTFGQTAVNFAVVSLTTNHVLNSKAEELDDCVTCLLKFIVLCSKKVFKIELSRHQIRTIMYYGFRYKREWMSQKMCQCLGINIVSYYTVKV